MATLTRYCPRCYERNEWADATCRRCGAALEADDSFDERLVWALDHPEPATAIRAAEALGRRRYAPAVPALARVAGTSPDPYLARAATQALLEFEGDPAAQDALRRLRTHASVLVRQVAASTKRSVPHVAGAHAAGRGCPRGDDRIDEDGAGRGRSDVW